MKANDDLIAILNDPQVKNAVEYLQSCGFSVQLYQLAERWYKEPSGSVCSICGEPILRSELDHVVETQHGQAHQHCCQKTTNLKQP